MSERSGRSWLNYALGLACLGAIVAAVLAIGPASSSSASSRRTAKAAAGVVQSTVSGSGNLEPASQLNLGFKTSGTVEHVYVKEGQYVTAGKLIATLDPVPAEVTLEQARATLQSAEASLARELETDGEGGGPNGSQSPSESRSGSTGAAGSTLSPATRKANIASARAQVKSDELTVRGDEEAVAATKLYAPRDGTIVSLSGQVGEVVSATGTSRASSAGSSTDSGSAGSSGSGRSGSGSGDSGAAASSGSGSGGSTQAFAVLSDLSSMKLVAALSESEIHEVKIGQIATVTVEALEGRTQGGTPLGAQAGKLAAHVSEVATLSSSSSGVVSYDVTFALDQMDPGLKPGMSATAEVVVKQEAGVSVPSSAISGGTVTVVRAGKDVPQQVSTGLAGNSTTIVLSGLHAGETVLLPQAASSGASSLSSLLRSRLGGGGGGALLGGGGGGGGAVFRAGGG
ncbi:MAG TPA: biotin/lipoyl-binding protein [Solirubrobacteraceae bacterium]|nr:biotin/lipoyl-binding protein [Solirubrobacteraceae bacterium]